MSSSQLPESTFILVVGGGPVGILSALALARYGYHSVIVEQYPRRLGQPKAHVLNPRTAEILRQYSIDVGRLRKLGLAPEEADGIHFVDTVKGIEYGTIDSNGSHREANATPEPLFNVAQPIVEDYILEKALSTGKVTFLRSHEWQSCVKDPQTNDITSTVLLRENNTTKQIKSKYIIGCDGANGISRDILGIPFTPLNNEPEITLHFASVHFNADLSHLKPGLLFFILKPHAMGAFIAYNRKNSWVYTIGYDYAATPKEKITSEWMKALVEEGLGEPVQDYKDLGITFWTTGPKIANTYRSKTIPNAFISGDAAHSFPPTGGMGVNTGIADVHNLAWKIHAVEQGWTSERFLDTFTTERWPVANDNAVQSKTNEDKLYRLILLIFKPGATAENLWADETSRKGIQNLILNDLGRFDAVNLQIGYVYGQKHTRESWDYKKECLPGGRLPHEWVQHKDGSTISTLDLVDDAGFVLFTSADFTNQQRFDVQCIPIRVIQLGREYFDPSGEFSKLLGLSQHTGLLVRPDQHIVGAVKSVDEVAPLLKGFLLI